MSSFHPSGPSLSSSQQVEQQTTQQYSHVQERALTNNTSLHPTDRPETAERLLERPLSQLHHKTVLVAAISSSLWSLLSTLPFCSPSSNSSDLWLASSGCAWYWEGGLTNRPVMLASKQSLFDERLVCCSLSCLLACSCCLAFTRLASRLSSLGDFFL